MWNIFEHSLTSCLFQQVDVYLNEPIKIDEQIKLANQLIQRRTRGRNGKDNNNSYFKSKIWSLEALKQKTEGKNVMF